MKKIVNKKSYKVYYIIAGAIIGFVVLVGLYDILIINKVKGEHDIKSSLKYEILPEDKLIKNYDEYKVFIKTYLSDKEYKKELSDSSISSKDFDKKDYVAVFYESRMCSGESHVSGLSMSKDKVILGVTRYEEKNCDLSTRILFIPVDNDKYDSLPHIVIRKKIVNR